MLAVVSSSSFLRRPPLLFLSFSVLPALFQEAFGIGGNEFHIGSTSELIRFSDSVNSEKGYKGTTVFLDNDIAFSGQLFTPIGTDSRYFQGTFDGQGHTISNLTVNLRTQYVGLFGCTKGATIRNVVMDSSCSVTSVFSTSFAYVGGAVGGCSSDESICKLESIVSLANASFSGDIKSGNLFLGGVIGRLVVQSYDVFVTNCANYGLVTHSGKNVGSYAHIGGIAGSLYCIFHLNAHIQNCLNFGTISHSGTTYRDLYIGGILGWYSFEGTDKIENCVSAGKVVTLTRGNNTFIGGVVGYVNVGSANVTHCYWTGDMGNCHAFGGANKEHTNSSNYAHDSTQVEFNKTVIESLNSYNSLWSRWLLNANSNLVAFTLNSRASFALSTRSILLPSPAKSDEYVFSGWFKDSALTEAFTASEVTADTTLYSIYYRTAGYTVEFDPAGGTVTPASKNVLFNEMYGELPMPERVGHNFTGWCIEAGTLVTPDSRVAEARDHTLHAGWRINSYTVKFMSDGKIVKTDILEYNAPIVYPQGLAKRGCELAGWNPEPKRMPDYNPVIEVKWSCKQVSSSSSLGAPSHTIISVIVAPLFLVIIIIVLAISVVVLYRKNKALSGKSEKSYEMEKPLIYSDYADKEGEYGDTYESTGYRRVVTDNDDEVSPESLAGMPLDLLYKMYPPSYVKPTMKEALLEAGLTDKQANRIVKACGNATEFVEADKKLLEGFAKEDAAAVAMYTYDFGFKRFEKNPYRIINRSLVGRNYAALQKASGILYLMMSALRKLPRVTGITLYRGVRSGMKMSISHYHEGNTITWPALSSTSPDMKATKAFLAEGSKTGKAKGTLFIIEDGWGYDIQPYSLFPSEAEILLEPERQFKVISVLLSTDLTVVNLQMLDTPLALPQVFGEGKK